MKQTGNPAMNNQKNTLDFLETIGTQKALTSEAKEKTAAILNNFFVSEDEAIFEQFMQKAQEIRNKIYSNKVFLRGLIEFSSYCKNTCKYCGLNIKNKKIQRYRLTTEEILQAGEKINQANIKTVVLQSGEEIFEEDFICDLIIKIKKINPQMAVTLSLGEQNYKNLQNWKNAGADRYLLRIESSTKNHYEYLHHKRNIETRLECLKNLQELKYQTGSGIMTGLPKQNIKMIVDDILFFNENKFQMLGIGPFIPHHQTEFANQSKGTAKLALKTIIATRILNPYALIPATTALGSLDKDYRSQALLCGANVLMPNFTPQQQKSQYEIYPNKKCINENFTETSQNTFSELEKLAKDANMVLDFSRGDALN